MAKSNLLKEAIADAKAVRETAIANAKIALEEAFTPRLQSILSQKLQTELAGEDEDGADLEEEYGKEDVSTAGSTTLGGEPGGTPSGDTTKPHTELDPETGKETAAIGSELDDVTVVKEGEGQDEDGDGVIDDPTGASVTENDDIETDVEPEPETDEDELDLESIIRELESEFGEDEEDNFETPTSDEPVVDPIVAPEPEMEADPTIEPEMEVDPTIEPEMEVDPTIEPEIGTDEEDIDLDEILREMGYGDDEEIETPETEVPAEDFAEKEQELEEAYDVIKQLQGTINEVNLLNAKLLYSNKLFRNYEMTNEQKMKVVETLDRTVSVREVKLVFATLAESIKFGSTPKRMKTKITESFSSNVVPTTAPKKEIISESNGMAERFKELANIK